MKTNIKERMIAKMLLMRKQTTTSLITEFVALETVNILGKNAHMKTKHNKAIKLYKSILKYYPLKTLRYSFYPPVKGKNKKEVMENIITRSRIHRSINGYIKMASK